MEACVVCFIFSFGCMIGVFRWTCSLSVTAAVKVCLFLCTSTSPELSEGLDCLERDHEFATNICSCNRLCK